MNLIDESEMLAPRLELRWVRTGATWAQRECVYNLVIPLRELDIRREDKDGSEVRTFKTVELGRTEVVGGRSPLWNKEERIDTPFRDGAHAKWDAECLGNLPIYAVCDGLAMKMEPTP